MKRLMIFGCAVLLAVPAAAQAQNWKFATANAEKECFAMTYRGKAAIGFQAPNGTRVGAIMAIAPATTAVAPGDGLIEIGGSGGLVGTHPAKVKSDSQVITFFMRVETFEDFEALPDRWRFVLTKGGQKVLETEITGFTAALDGIRRCVAAR